METIAEMKARAHAQYAYGKWNTASLWNEIARREDEVRAPLHRAARRVGTVLFLVAAYALTLAPIAIFIKNLFVLG